MLCTSTSSNEKQSPPQETSASLSLPQESSASRFDSANCDQYKHNSEDVDRVRFHMLFIVLLLSSIVIVSENTKGTNV